MNKTKIKKNFPAKGNVKTKAKSTESVVSAIKEAATLPKWFFVFLFIYAFLLYINTYSNDYAFDDSVAITSNKFTQLGVKGIPDLLTKDFFEGIYGKALELGGGRYRPLSLITFAIEVSIFGQNPHYSHLVNVLLFAITALVLLKTLLELFPKMPWIAAVSGLLFVSHPIHTEVVANIKSRDEILSFLGLLYTLLYLVRYAREGKKIYMVFACVWYFLSLLSKENGITFIAIIPITLYLFNLVEKGKVLRTSLPLILIAVFYVLLRWKLVGMIGDRTNKDIMENPFVNTNWMERTATISHILGKYLWLLIFPHPLSSDYSFNQIPIIQWSNIKALIPFVIYLGMGIYAMKTMMKHQQSSFMQHVIAWCILIYLSSIFLVSNLVFNIGAPMGERFLYLPSFVFCIAIALLALKVLKIDFTSALSFKPALMIPLIAVLALYSFKTVKRNKDWYDNIALFTADVKAAPNSAKSHYYLGNNVLNQVLSDRENPKKNEWLTRAKYETVIAVRINPVFHHAHYNLGQIYNELGMADSAIYHLEEVLKLQPTHIQTQGTLGAVYGKLKGDYDKAIYYLNKAIEFNPKDAAAYENIGIAYAIKGMFKESLSNFGKAMELNPDQSKLYMNMGGAYYNSGDTLKAKEFFAKAKELEGRKK